MANGKKLEGPLYSPGKGDSLGKEKPEGPKSISVPDPLGYVKKGK